MTSSQCKACGKAVFFAEKKSSFGFDYHPGCLKCHCCGRRLNPGGHSHHAGMSYCNRPCYSSMFGPEGLGRGNASRGISHHDVTAGDGLKGNVATADQHSHDSLRAVGNSALFTAELQSNGTVDSVTNAETADQR